MHTLYLDFNCTTPLAPSVREAMEPFWTEHFMLPGQDHRGSRTVADALQLARENVAMLVGCDAFEIVFTSGGTESNNLAVLGVANRCTSGHMVVSALEHDSVLHAVNSLANRGWKIDVAKPNQSGVVTVEAIQKLLRHDTKLVCLQAANPVFGTFQPVREVADLCHTFGIPVHCDAVQVFGKEPLDVAELRVDTLSVSGHKFYGPKGAGGLYVRRGFLLSPVAFGETREMGLRPGTENVSNWIGMGAAARLAGHCARDAAIRMAELKQNFIARLTQSMNHQCSLICSESDCLPNTAVVELPCEATRVLRNARQLVISIPRAAAPADEMTRCLQAIGMSPDRIKRCCRISLGWTTSGEQVDRAAELLAEACDRC